jgi:tryptophan synthase alpha chain
MNRIDQCFVDLKAAGKKALIPYITGGDPKPGLTVELMHVLVETGADIIEIGVPFSDPMADGPVIQLACERALAHNTSLRDILAMIKKFRSENVKTPVVLMGYLNPVEVIGYDAFVNEATDAGVDGVLLVDMPPEEAVNVGHLFKEKDLKMIYLMAPTTPDYRVDLIARESSGYIYYVSVKGVTGSAALDVDDVELNLKRIRAKTDLPLAVGFGISGGKTAAAVSKISDGVIVGSALVKCIANNPDEPEVIKANLSALMNEMRQAMDATSN